MSSNLTDYNSTLTINWSNQKGMMLRSLVEIYSISVIPVPTVQALPIGKAIIYSSLTLLGYYIRTSLLDGLQIIIVITQSRYIIRCYSMLIGEFSLIYRYYSIFISNYLMNKVNKYGILSGIILSVELRVRMDKGHLLKDVFPYWFSLYMFILMYLMVLNYLLGLYSRLLFLMIIIILCIVYGLSSSALFGVVIYGLCLDIISNYSGYILICVSLFILYKFISILLLLYYYINLFIVRVIIHLVIIVSLFLIYGYILYIVIDLLLIIIDLFMDNIYVDLLVIMVIVELLFILLFLVLYSGCVFIPVYRCSFCSFRAPSPVYCLRQLTCNSN